MKIHNVTVKAYAAEREVPDLTKTLQGILPEGTKIEKTPLEPEADGGVFTHALYELKARIAKRPEKFFADLLSGLSDEERERLRNEVRTRTDEDCNFYMRLGKRDAASGKISLRRNDPIHVKVKVATFPSSREKAIVVMEELLK